MIRNTEIKRIFWPVWSRDVGDAVVPLRAVLALKIIWNQKAVVFGDI